MEARDDPSDEVFDDPHDPRSFAVRQPLAFVVGELVSIRSSPKYSFLNSVPSYGSLDHMRSIMDRPYYGPNYSWPINYEPYTQPVILGRFS